MEICNNLKFADAANLINFYQKHENNDFRFEKNEKNLSISSFNVHGWMNINKKIKKIDNFMKIIKMFDELNLDILILQEVSPLVTKNLNFIYSEFSKIGFKYHFSVPNGQYKKIYDSFISIFSKKEIQERNKLDLTIINLVRYIPIVKINDIQIAGIHLEIGYRFHHLLDSDLRKQIILGNEQIRKKQLEKLLENYKNLDIIIGDFNFQPTDKEFNIIQQNFNYFQELSNSNPYNRSDMCFLAKHNKILCTKFMTLSCNYSDHLPIINEFLTFDKKN